MILQVIGILFFVLAILSFFVEKIYNPRRQQRELAKSETKPVIPEEIKKKEKEELYNKVQVDLEEKAAIKKKIKDEQNLEKLLKLQETSRRGEGNTLRNRRSQVEEDALKTIDQIVQNYGSTTSQSNATPNPELEEDRKIRAEQEREFQQSVEKDRKKEIQKQAEENKLKQKEEMRKKFKESEPSQGIQILIRLPDGNRLERKFNATDTVQILLDFVNSQEFATPKNFQLVTNFPRVVYSNATQTLKEAAIPEKAVLLVEEV